MLQNKKKLWYLLYIFIFSVIIYSVFFVVVNSKKTFESTDSYSNLNTDKIIINYDKFEYVFPFEFQDNLAFYVYDKKKVQWKTKNIYEDFEFKNRIPNDILIKVDSNLVDVNDLSIAIKSNKQVLSIYQNNKLVSTQSSKMSENLKFYPSSSVTEIIKLENINSNDSSILIYAKTSDTKFTGNIDGITIGNTSALMNKYFAPSFTLMFFGCSMLVFGLIFFNFYIFSSKTKSSYLYFGSLFCISASFYLFVINFTIFNYIYDDPYFWIIARALFFSATFTIFMLFENTFTKSSYIRNLVVKFICIFVVYLFIIAILECNDHVPSFITSNIDQFVKYFFFIFINIILAIDKFLYSKKQFIFFISTVILTIVLLVLQIQVNGQFKTLDIKVVISFCLLVISFLFYEFFTDTNKKNLYLQTQRDLIENDEDQLNKLSKTNSKSVNSFNIYRYGPKITEDFCNLYSENVQVFIVTHNLISQKYFIDYIDKSVDLTEDEILSFAKFNIKFDERDTLSYNYKNNTLSVSMNFENNYILFMCIVKITPFTKELEVLTKTYLTTVYHNILNIFIYDEIFNEQKSVLEAIGSSISKRYKNPENTDRTAFLCYLISHKSGYDKDHAKKIALASYIKDIGQLSFDEDMFSKAEKTMKNVKTTDFYEHAIIGHSMLSMLEGDIMEIAKVIALEHHENYDGSGYLGLSNDEISFYGALSKIAADFDIFYEQENCDIEKVFEFIQSSRGILFKPELVDIFIDSKSEITDFYNSFTC